MYEPGSLDIAEMLDLLGGIADDLSAAISGVDDAGLDRQTPGKDLTITGVCRLVAAEAQQAHAYLRHVTGDPLEVEPVEVSGLSALDSIDALRGVRAQTIALLGKLDPTAWKRSAPDQLWGHLTIEETALRLVATEEQALDDIAQIKRVL